MTGRFNIREDLEDRPQAQQIEILWISGPYGSPRTDEERAAHVTRVAGMLGTDEATVLAVVQRGRS